MSAGRKGSLSVSQAIRLVVYEPGHVIVVLVMLINKCMWTVNPCGLVLETKLEMGKKCFLVPRNIVSFFNEFLLSRLLNRQIAKHNSHWNQLCLKRILEPTTTCDRDQDATTVLARNREQTGSLNWAQFMPQWFIRFLNSLNFSSI